MAVPLSSSPADAAVTFRNGEPCGSAAPTPSEFLCTNPRGAYTAARTYGHPLRLAHWESHMRRLAQHVRLLAEVNPDIYGTASQALATSGNDKLWESFDLSVTASAAAAIRHLRACPSYHAQPHGTDLMVTTLVCGRTDHAGRQQGAQVPIVELLDVRTHATLLHLPPLTNSRGAAHMSPPTQVAVLGTGRRHPLIKDSQWARDRQWLQAAKQPLQPCVSEIILSCGGDGEQLLEGLVTNLFVVTRDRRGQVQVQTASLADGVLPGVVRAHVLQVCERLGFAVVERAPARGESSSWCEAFLTGSGSIIKPVSAIHWLAPRAPALGGGHAVSHTMSLPEECGLITMQIFESLVSQMPEWSLLLPEVD